jgi:hypothetical protein
MAIDQLYARHIGLTTELTVAPTLLFQTAIG